MTLDGLAGLEGWQIMFLAEGIPAVLLGIVVLRFLPNGPDEAGWLEPEERSWLRRVLERENRIKSEHGEYTTCQALINGKVWLLSAIYFGVVTSVYGVSLWLPLIIEDFSDFGTFAVGLLSAILYFAGAVGMVIFARHSDATGERRWHVAVAAFIATVGLILTGDRFASCGYGGAYAGRSGYLQHARHVLVASDSFLERHGRGGGDRTDQLCRNLGGFVGPYVVGFLSDLTGSFYAGLLVLAALILVAGLLALAVRHERRLEEVEDVITPITGTPASS